MTLQEYFQKNWDRVPYPVIDHAVRAERGADGCFRFYIHPAMTDGDTVDFLVRGNKLENFRFDTLSVSQVPKESLVPDESTPGYYPPVL